jgi:hypothetical protein
MKKRTAKAKKVQSKQDHDEHTTARRAWFEQKVAELGEKLNKLPAARQEQLEREHTTARRELRNDSKR